MKKVLLSVCLVADSTAVAWSKHPGEFSQIQAMVMPQPVSGSYIVEEFVKSIGMEDSYAKDRRGRPQAHRDFACRSSVHGAA